jgi:hypothetical protein
MWCGTFPRSGIGGRPVGVGADAAGNVYVAGTARFSQSDSDLTVTKWAP